MTPDRILAEAPWSYVAFERDGASFLTFMRGGPIEVDATVRLLPEEVDRIRSNPETAATLVRDFLEHPHTCEARLAVPPLWPRKP